jgi:hypothetical protein
MHGGKRNAYRVLVGKPEGSRLLGRPREIEWGGMDWINLAQNRDQWRALVNALMNLRVPQNAGKFLSSCKTGGFSRRAQIHEVS